MGGNVARLRYASLAALREGSGGQVDVRVPDASCDRWMPDIAWLNSAQRTISLLLAGASAVRQAISGVRPIMARRAHGLHVEASRRKPIFVTDVPPSESSANIRSGYITLKVTRS